MPSKRGLDRAQVVAAAAALADQAGSVDAVTLADLAAHLGLSIPSLYYHVPGLPGLRRELALLGLRQLGATTGRAVMGRAGDEAVLALGHAYRAFATAHPGLYSATVRAPDPADPDLVAARQEVLDVLLAVITPYGMAPDVALHTLRGLRSLAHGFVSLEAAGGFGLPFDRDASYTHSLRLFIAGLHQMGTA